MTARARGAAAAKRRRFATARQVLRDFARFFPEENERVGWRRDDRARYLRDALTALRGPDLPAFKLADGSVIDGDTVKAATTMVVRHAVFGRLRYAQWTADAPEFVEVRRRIVNFSSSPIIDA